MKTLPVVILACPRCGGDQLHAVYYAGPLLLRTVCAKCGVQIGPNPETLYHEYLRSLEHRALTKPRRVFHYATAHPRDFAVHLPGSLVTKPFKLYDEWVALRSKVKA